jgi:hypothetical protein
VLEALARVRLGRRVQDAREIEVLQLEQAARLLDKARRREATRFAGRFFVMWRSSVGSCGARALRGLPYTVEDGCDPPNGPGPEEIPPQVVCLAFVYCRQARLSTVFS